MTSTFQRFAGSTAVLAAAVSVIYTITFALYVREDYHWAHWASAIAFMASGLIVVPVFVALHARVREHEPQFAMLALVAGLVGAFGASIHGAFDVAVLAKPVEGKAASFPSQIDPRGFLTFAITGAALGLFGWLSRRNSNLPRALAPVGGVATLLLLVVYFGRMIAVDPNRNFIRFSAVVVGLVIVPAFYALVARSLLGRAKT
ncbi:MAG: hypothetical protein WD598_11475 [Acidimicrobiia bacterium]